MKKLYILFLTIFTMLACKNDTKKSVSPQEVNVYTHRHYPADQELFAAFEKETGIKVNVINLQQMFLLLLMLGVWFVQK